MKSKIFLTAVILSVCMSLFICPEVSGRINKADGYGAFAACDTWQKWAEHITNGDFEFTGFAQNDKEGSEDYDDEYEDCPSEDDEDDSSD